MATDAAIPLPEDTAGSPVKTLKAQQGDSTLKAQPTGRKIAAKDENYCSLKQAAFNLFLIKILIYFK